MSRGAEVDVVVLTWNDGELLAAAVDSALASQGVDVRVIVLDNGSEPPAEVVDDPLVTLLREPENRGVAGGRNLGVRAGRSPYVCLLDSDARLTEDCLATLLDPLAEDERIVMAVPVFVDQPPEASVGRAPTTRTKLERLANRRDTYQPADHGSDPWWPVDFGIGACQLFRRAGFDAVDGLDETYFYGPEDVDFCLRLRRAGWRIVQVEGARCHHPPRRRFRRILTKRGMQHGWAVTRFLWRHRGFERKVAS